jgi:hypothetical protein
MPLAHLQWGNSYPGDGQQASGFIIVFAAIGLVAGAIFLLIGSLGQFLLRKRPLPFTVLADLGLFLAFAAVLVLAAVSARYK